MSKANTLLLSPQKVCGLFNRIQINEINDADGNGILDNFINENFENEKNFNKCLNEEILKNENAAIRFFSIECELEENNLNNLEDQNQISSQLDSENSQLFYDLNLNFENDQQLISNDLFLYENNSNQNTQSDEINQNQQLDLDHLYSTKRQFGNEEEADANKDSANRTKKQRTKGVYRARDVKTDQDFEDYTERRIKNNKSSKISRLNKKKTYNQIEQNCDQLENENKQLNEKIEELQKKIKAIKDFLISNLNSN